MISSRVSVMIVPLLCLLATGCAMPKMSDVTGNKPDPEQEAKQVAASREGSCQSQAKERLSLFDRPDTYPVSAEEKNNAYQALYTQCLKSYEVTANTPKPNFEVAAASTAGTDLANLSPAAGGNAKPANNGAVTYANGMMIIDTARLTGLSPAAGGTPAAGTAVSSTGGPNGSTVVVVQAPPSATAIAYPPMPVAPTGPAAIPMAPVQQAAQPVAPATAPKPTMKADTEKKPAVKKKKVAKAEAPATEEKRSVIFEESRFKKNAKPVAVDLSAKKSDLNALQPAAGNLLDNAVSANRPAAKD